MSRYAALLLAAGILAATAAAEAEPAPAPAGIDYTDPSQFFSLRLAGAWDRWPPEMVDPLTAQSEHWPETTAIFSMALDPENYTCPCLWVARFENGDTAVDFPREIQRGTYHAGALERLAAGADRVPAWTNDPSQLFYDSERGVVWGWGEQTGAERAAALKPGTRERRGNLVLGAVGAGVLALVVAAAVSGARRGGAGFAVKCACLALFSSALFLGNFVVAFNDGEGWEHGMRVGHSLTYALTSVCLIPGIFVGVTRWRRGANSGRLTRAWIWGTLLSLVLVIQELAKNIKS